MKISVWTFCLMSMLFVGINAHAQYIHDYQGKAYSEQNYTNMVGDPYLIPRWFEGSVQFVDKKPITVKLKYNLLNDQLLFQNARDSSAMVFIDPVKSFSFNMFKIDESDLAPLVFTDGYPAIDAQTPTSFYQVIADGKVKLLKRYRKIIRTDQAFNSATATQSFEMINPVYYIVTGGTIARIKPGQKAIMTALGDKADKLQAYIKGTSVNYKSDAELSKLFNYYNSL